MEAWERASTPIEAWAHELLQNSINDQGTNIACGLFYRIPQRSAALVEWIDHRDLHKNGCEFACYEMLDKTLQ